MSDKKIDAQKHEILSKAKTWFRDKVMENHKRNTLKLKDPRKFDINPFLSVYLAAFFDGAVTPQSVAKGLVYPRALGTSITTSFGTNMQQFVTDVLKSTFGSTTAGIDIEFKDQIDGRKKYCQVKLGPNTINKDDVKTVHDHFAGIRQLAKINHQSVQLTDLVIGILYGVESRISGHYKKLRDYHHYPIYVGQPFWHRLTGDAQFYDELIQAIASVALAESNGKQLLLETVNHLAASKIVKDIAAP